jgi:hypothetical protein
MPETPEQQARREIDRQLTAAGWLVQNRMKIEEVILQSKRAMRHHLAARPVAEKLRMLDSLRERALAIRGHASGDAPIRDEDPASCHPQP